MKSIFIIHTNNFERIHYALCMANTAAALNHDVIVFFASNSIKCVSKDNGWKKLKGSKNLTATKINEKYKKKGVISFLELIKTSIKLKKIKFLYCSMLDEIIRIPENFIQGLKIKSSSLSKIYLTENKNAKIIFI